MRLKDKVSTLLEQPVVYRDISNELVEIGDILVYTSKADLVELVAEVTAVQGETTDKEQRICRVFDVKILRASHEAPIGKNYRVLIPRAVEFMGAVLSYRESTRKLTKEQMNLLIAQEARKIVDSYPQKRATFADTLDILSRRNLLTGTEDKRKTRLGDAFKAYPEIIHSKGGYVRGGKLSLDGHKEFITGRKAIQVDFPKLVAGMRLVLTAFSVFELTGTDE